VITPNRHKGAPRPSLAKPSPLLPLNRNSYQGNFERRVIQPGYKRILLWSEPAASFYDAATSDPSTGRIWPHGIRGHGTIWLTSSEQRPYFYIFGIMAVAGAVIIILYVVDYVKMRRDKSRP